ncbi:hypothetical protein [Paenibacillus donghaensis]|uniref:hypothetical protein n=1 Tax=Paenibacillus donghaensis TaxID=414771 RepID=UPI001B806641|nr:hypothetical protein [Paenibacillus donghaensis]
MSNWRHITPAQQVEGLITSALEHQAEGTNSFYHYRQKNGSPRRHHAYSPSLAITSGRSGRSSGSGQSGKGCCVSTRIKTDGTLQDNVVYSILDHEWPGVKIHLQYLLEIKYAASSPHGKPE